MLSGKDQANSAKSQDEIFHIPLDGNLFDLSADKSMDKNNKYIDENNDNNNRDSGIIPFEFHALEALLTTVKALETQEFNKLNESVQETLAYFKSGSLLLPVTIQERMRYLKNDLSRMMSRISSSRKALQVLTEDDEEMALMNLTVLMDNPALYRFPLVPEILGRHDEIEVNVSV
jgi:citrate synthase